MERLLELVWLWLRFYGPGGAVEEESRVGSPV